MKDTAFTNDLGVAIIIHWDDLKYQHLESIDHSKLFECRGYDDSGTEYTGIATYTCGELDGITDIEVLNLVNN